MLVLLLFIYSCHFERYHDASPRYCRSSLTVDGGSSSAMAATSSRSMPNPSHSMAKIKQFSLENMSFFRA